MCVADWQVAKNMGLKKSDLLLPALSVSVADNSSLDLIGAHFLTITAKSGHVSEQLVYFVADIGEFYLSKAALIDLAVISKDFPQPGSCSTDTFTNNPSPPYRPTYKADINEAQDGFTSELRLGQTKAQVQQSSATSSSNLGNPIKAGNTANIMDTFNNSKGSHGILNRDSPGNWDGVTCEDVGPDWSVEFPGHGKRDLFNDPPTERVFNNEVQGEFSPELQCQPPPNIATHSYLRYSWIVKAESWPHVAA